MIRRVQLLTTFSILLIAAGGMQQAIGQSVNEVVTDTSLVSNEPICRIHNTHKRSGLFYLLPIRSGESQASCSKRGSYSP